MKTFVRQFSVSFSASSSGSYHLGFEQFNLPTGYYKVEVWAEGSLTDQAISISTLSSPYYQYYNGAVEPVLVALFNPAAPAGLLSFDAQAVTNNASTLTGVIFISEVESV